MRATAKDCRARKQLFLGSPMRGWSFKLAACSSLLCLLSGMPAPTSNVARAQTLGMNREYTIKAAFLYQFSNYVQWPADVFASDTEPFVIGVYQTNPFSSALERIAETKKVGGRTIAIRLIESPKEVSACQILFIPASVPPELQHTVLNAAEDAKILVVGETSDFVTLGGDVQFFLADNKVRFAMNAEVASNGQLKVSSKLLSLAKLVTASTDQSNVNP